MPCKEHANFQFMGEIISVPVIRGISKRYAKFFVKNEKARILQDCYEYPNKYMGDYNGRARQQAVTAILPLLWSKEIPGIQMPVLPQRMTLIKWSNGVGG